MGLDNMHFPVLVQKFIFFKIQVELFSDFFQSLKHSTENGQLP